MKSEDSESENGFSISGIVLTVIFCAGFYFSWEAYHVKEEPVFALIFFVAGIVGFWSIGTYSTVFSFIRRVLDRGSECRVLTKVNKGKKSGERK